MQARTANCHKPIATTTALIKVRRRTSAPFHSAVGNSINFCPYQRFATFLAPNADTHPHVLRIFVKKRTKAAEIQGFRTFPGFFLALANLALPWAHVFHQQFPARVFGSARFSCFIARRACGLGRRGDCGGGDRALVRIHAGRRCWVRTATMGHPCPLLEVVRIRSSCSQLSAGNGRHLDQLKGEQHFVQMSDRFQTKAVKQVPHAFPKSTFAAQFVQHGLKQRIA